MFENFLSALDDYMDLHAEKERERPAGPEMGNWHDYGLNRRREAIVTKMQAALDAYIKDKTS